MASESIIKKKQELVADLTVKIKGAVSGVIVDYKGISVENDSKMRSELREMGVEYKVIKNGILVRSVDEAGYEGLKEYLVGPSALALSVEDAIAPAKIIAKYASKLDGHFEIKAGFIEGRVVNQSEIIEISKLPSREELVAKALGSLMAPISGLVTVLNGNIRGLVVALGQIVEQKEQSA